MSGKHVVRLLTVLSLVGVAALARSSGGFAKPASPSMRMIGALTHVDVSRFKGQSDLFFATGIYAGSTAGAFEIDARQQPDGSYQLWQVRRTSTGPVPIRHITPDGPVDITAGLPNFFNASLTNARGVVVSSQELSFCPGGGGGFQFFAAASRTDTTGPANPTYPQTCGTGLTQNAIWGLDQGWAIPIDLDMQIGKIKDAAYTLTVSITPAYATQLGVPSSAASSSVIVNLVTGDGGCPPPKCPPPAAAANASTGVRQGQAKPLASHGPVDSALTGSGVPNLQALPAHDLSIEHADDNHDYLDFGATIWNSGSGPLALEGFRQGTSDTMPVTQFIYQNDKPTSSTPAGHFVFDRRVGRDVWDMPDIAQYDLLDAAGNQIVQSQKQSFCLAPTDPIDLTLPGAEWQPDGQYLYSQCGGEDAIWIREALPAGWGDTYYQSSACQAFDITALPNGSYQVRVTVDPSGDVDETSHADNASIVHVVLGGTAGHRVVTIV